jgi:hypothetical protein
LIENKKNNVNPKECVAGDIYIEGSRPFSPDSPIVPEREKHNEKTPFHPPLLFLGHPHAGSDRLLGKAGSFSPRRRL